MKTNSRKSKRPTEAKTSRTAKRKGDYVQRLVGHTYVFMREGHDWHGCEVTLISKDPTGCVVTLATATWRALVMGAQCKLGKPFALVVTPCTESELW